MPEDKTSTQELVWLYRLNQAPLLVEESGSEPFLRTGGYHYDPYDCPCAPWDECACGCHTQPCFGLPSNRETPAL